MKYSINALSFFQIFMRSLFIGSFLILGACQNLDGKDSDFIIQKAEFYANKADAPVFKGEYFKEMRIYDVKEGQWVNDIALFEEIQNHRVVWFGEKHETSPIQNLELWMYKKMLSWYPAVNLAMEHFQQDEQEVLDNWLKDDLNDKDFMRYSQPWTNFNKYWRPLIEVAKAEGLPVYGLNVPKEVLDELYSQFPKTPWNLFNKIKDSHLYAEHLPPRPIQKWSASYQKYFERSFAYDSHGKSWGLTYQQALDYFTDLAVIRDATMGWWVKEIITQSVDPVLVTAGDWHVRNGIASPDHAAFYDNSARGISITTSTHEDFEKTLSSHFEDTYIADYIFVYAVK